MTIGAYRYLFGGIAMRAIIEASAPAAPSHQVVLSDTARGFAKASLAKNSRRAYAAQWRLWEDHCKTIGQAPIPANATAVANWISQRATSGRSGGKRGRDGARGHAIATVRTAVAATRPSTRRAAFGSMQARLICA